MDMRSRVRKPVLLACSLVTTLLLSILNIVPAFAVAPTVLNVTSTAVDGIYGSGDVIDVAVQFSQIVTVTSTPTLQIRHSSLGVTSAPYSVGSGTDTLVFRFTAPSTSSTSDLDYAATTSLAGTIRNSALEQAVLTLPAPGAVGSLGANKNIKFETFANQISSSITFQNSHLLNMVSVPSRGTLFVADGNNIAEVNTALSSKTTFLDTGGLISSLSVIGDHLYWISGSSIKRTPFSNPTTTTYITHTSDLIGFARTGLYWVAVDTSRRLYRFTDDGLFTKTLVATLDGTVVDDRFGLNSAMQSSPNPEKVIWRGLSTGIVTEIDVSTGATSTYADLRKCSTSIRGMARLADGSEIYGAYSPTNLLTRRWPDGRISCSPTSASPWMFGQVAVDGDFLYASVYGSTSNDYRIWRFTPTSTTWTGAASTLPPVINQPTSVETPQLSGGGAIVYKGLSATISATASVAGRVTFWGNGKRIAGCQNLATISLVATCTWRPAVQGSLRITAHLNPTDSNNLSSISAPLNLGVNKRNTTR